MAISVVDTSKSLPPINESSAKDVSDLEDIDYNAISVPKLRKASSSMSFQPVTKGLGLIPRRPSDTMINRLNQQNSSSNSTSSTSNLRICTTDRPQSNDSLSTASVVTSDFSDYNADINSRNSSMTNESISERSGIDVTKGTGQLYMVTTKTKTHSTSTLVNHHHHQRSAKINTPNASTSSLPMMMTSRLTPSQKYRMKRENSKLTLKNREKLYDDMSIQGRDALDDEEDLIWNVPFTKGVASIFSSTAGKSPALINKIFDQSPISMPMSPLPGSISAPSSPMPNNININNKIKNNNNNNNNNNRSSGNSFYSLPSEAASISEFYQASSSSYFEKQLKERQDSSTNLPNYIQEASVVGLEDMSLVSEEKIKTLSSSRPIWLPPKSTKENKRHEREINLTLEDSVRFDKEVKLREEQQAEKIIKYTKRWIDVSQHSKIYKYSSECKRLVFKTSIPQNLRFKIWKSLLQRDLANITFEPYEELNQKFVDNVKDFPRSKTEEIEELVSQFKRTSENTELLNNLSHLMKLKMISNTGLNENSDPIIIYSLLLAKFTLSESFEMLSLINEKVFNKSNNIDKFTSSIQTNHTLKRLLGTKEFQNDLDTMCFSQLFQIMLNLIKNSGKSAILLNLLDILVIYQGDYKIVMSIFIAILRDYHFGFTCLNQLNKVSAGGGAGLKSCGENLYINEDSNQFVERVYYYYKKF